MPVTRQITFDEVYERIDVEDWEAAWDLQGDAWQHPDRIAFPTAFSSTSEWQLVARYAPEQLLQLVKLFALPGELLKSLDVSVMVQWMTERRRDFLSEGLSTTAPGPHYANMDRWVD